MLEKWAAIEAESVCLLIAQTNILGVYRVTLFTRKNIIETDEIYSGHIFNVRVDKLKAPGGELTIREVVEHRGGAVIVCLPEPDKILLIKQYRYSIDTEIVELPAGRIEKGEPPLSTAQRELTEETGYVAKEWSEFARMFSAPGFSSEILYFYKATNVEFVGKSLDHDEETEVLIMPIKDAWKLVHSAPIIDAKTVAALGMLMNG